MNKRIRYIQLPDGILRSVRMFRVEDYNYEVQLNPTALEFLVTKYHVHEFEIPEVIRNGTGKSLHDLKENAKRELVSLGVQFDNETRKRNDVEVV